MIVKSETALKSIESGNASFDGITAGHGDLRESSYAIITNHEHQKVDHVEIEKHVIGDDFEAVVLETGILFCNNNAETTTYTDFENMVENIGEWAREELESLF